MLHNFETDRVLRSVYLEEGIVRVVQGNITLYIVDMEVFTSRLNDRVNLFNVWKEQSVSWNTRYIIPD